MLDNFRGCVLGLACGDALGATLEFKERDWIKTNHGELRDMVGGGWLHLAPGETTDDTHMAMDMLQSIVEHGDVRPDDIAARFLAWRRSGPKDIGSLTSASLGFLAGGASWQDAGKMAWDASGGEAAGNGGVMRCAPIGLFRYANIPALIEESRQTCLITHYDPRCQESCVAVNWMIAELVQGHDPTLEALSAVVTHGELLDALRSTDGATTAQMAALAKGGYTISTLAVAYWALRTYDSYEEGVVKVVNLGGDADTTGAVTGALLGAKYGAAAIPGRWRRKLQNRDHLEDLATRLYELTQR